MLKTKNNGKVKPGQEKQNYLPNNNAMSGIFDIPGFGGFGGIGGGPSGWGPSYGGASGRTAPLSEPWEMMYNNTYFMLSMLRTVLTYAYVIHGPLRTLVDLPCYDAFRGGVKITTDEVSPEELEDFHRALKKEKIFRKVINAMRWERLYGGSGIILNTNQDFRKPFDIESINEESPINFIVVDRWQLNWTGIPHQSNFIYNPGGDMSQSNILTANIDRSRVALVIGEEAPALIRQRLQGYGMSVIECVIREVNLYFKENNVLFELIDEAKIDIWSIDGFNAQTLSKQAKGVTALRLQIATWMKNFLNAIVLDSKDKYEQKQITFSGLAEILKQIQIGIAAACRMPVSKLFGLSATGFDSGESDLETYNAIVEGERAKSEDVLEWVLPIMMMKRWGFVPDDWKVKWPNLRVLTQEQEQNIMTQKYAINSGLYTQGMLTPKEYAAKNKEEGICTMETKVGKGAEPEPPIMPMMDMEEPDAGSTAKKKESQGKSPKKAKT